MSPIFSPATVTCVRRPYIVRGSGIQKTPIISALGITSRNAVGRLPYAMPASLKIRPSGTFSPRIRARMRGLKTSILSLTAPIDTGQPVLSRASQRRRNGYSEPRGNDSSVQTDRLVPVQPRVSFGLRGQPDRVGCAVPHFNGLSARPCSVGSALPALNRDRRDKP